MLVRAPRVYALPLLVCALVACEQRNETNDVVFAFSTDASHQQSGQMGMGGRSVHTDIDDEADSMQSTLDGGAAPHDTPMNQQPENTSGNESPSGENQPTAPASRFADTFMRWSLPESGLDDGFFFPWWGHGQRWFACIDITGDGLPDLVQTADTNRPNGFIWRDDAGPHWRVFEGFAGGFSSIYSRWAMPESGLEDGFFYTQWSDGKRWFSTRDINADGRPDLIQTADSAEDGGQIWRDDQGPYWKVWLNQNDGFAGEHLRWRVPESGLDDGFFALHWSAGKRWFTTIDINNDGWLDLIQTADPTRDGGHVLSDNAGAFWRVWYGRSGGFQSVATRWAVPDSGLPDGFFATQWTQGERVFATIDITGDGQLDLVQTADPAQSAGKIWRDQQGHYWRVWTGLRTGGFAPEWVRWAVPESGLPDGFFAPWYMNGQRYFTTMDISGDGRLDLVQTADSSRAGGHVWTDDDGAYWRVWRGMDGGFESAPRHFRVPSSGLSDGFYSVTAAQNSRWYTMVDVDGNGTADLVQTGDNMRDGGHAWRDDTGPYWRVWLAE